MKKQKIAKEIKEQIINRIKNEGVSVSEAATEHGLSPNTIYSQFKVELGDPNRFETLGELVAEIYQRIHYYNHKRIHTSLGMSPEEFAQKHKFAYDLIMQ